MSKPRYNWWPFVLNMIRDYPGRAKDIKEIRQQKVTADTSGMPGGGGASRTTEGVAMRELPEKQAQREYEAVHKALTRTRARVDGKLRADVVKLTLWKGYTIRGAATLLNTSDDTARRYRWQFIMLVGCCYGFLTEEEYRAAVKREMIGQKLESQSQKDVLS